MMLSFPFLQVTLYSSLFGKETQQSQIITGQEVNIFSSKSKEVKFDRINFSSIFDYQ